MAQSNDAPWSAAFVSWVVKTAAARTTGLTFPYNAAHVEYANAIRRGGFPWQALDPFGPGSLGPIPIELKAGDIIVKGRSNNILTFDKWDRTIGWGGTSHGDVVIEDLVGPGAEIVGGNLSDKVRSIKERNLRAYFVVLRPNSRAHGAIIRDVAKEELKLWEDNGWTSENQEGARQRVALYWGAVGIPYIPSSKFTNPGIPPQEAPTSPNAITPFIESLESFHPKIQYELTRRRIASETANTYIPFVKLTSLSKVPKQLLDGTNLNNLPDSETFAYCPSLGIHGLDEVSFEDIYLTQDDRSTVAYGISRDGNRTIPILVENASKDAKNVPIPGITQINVERGTAGPMGVRGGLMKADLKIVAYSVGQIDALLRYFLRPATRVVLELGRTSSNSNEIKITPFDWKKAVRGELSLPIEKYFTSLIESPELQKDFIKQYVYNNYGNYEIFIGYVVKFNLKYNKNNTFEIDLTVHSVQQFEVPTKHTAVQSICPSPTSNCNVMDIQEYFNDQYSWKDNHFSKLISYYKGLSVNGVTISGEDAKWSSQIVSIKNDDSNQNQGEQRTGGAASTNAGTRDNEYFVSWNFFVEKILNDRRYGIASMLGNDESVKAISELALIRPVREPTGSQDTSGLISNEVGYHPALRSVNPSVMIIYNEQAQEKYKNSTDKLLFESLKDTAATNNNITDQTLSTKLSSTGITNQIIGSSKKFYNHRGTNTEAGASYLTRGVWLNTRAIKQAFTSTDTISSAISVLLNMMNSATEGYWNLQLYSTDVKNPGMHVIDMGLSKEPKLVFEDGSLSVDKEDATDEKNILNSISGININRYYGATEDTPKYIYMFNRGTKLLNDGELGSDLIDLNVEFNMPQVIAVQAIANIGGPAQKSTLQSIKVEELREISLIQGLYTPCSNPTTSGNCESDEVQRLRESASYAQINIDRAKRARDTSRQNSLRTDAQAFRDESLVTNAERELQSIRNQLNVAMANEFNPNLVGTIREYADLGTALELMEFNPSRMMKELNLDSTTSPTTTHAFNSSNLTKTVVDVTLPGIGGINLFQSFLVDRVPSIIDRGFYVVTKIIHEFSSQNGWITKIQGRFRYRPNIAERKTTPSTTSTDTVRGQRPAIDLNTAPMRNRMVSTNIRSSNFDPFRNPLGR